MKTFELVVEQIKLHRDETPDGFSEAVKAARRSTIMRFKTGAALYSPQGELLGVGWSHVPNGTLQTTKFSQHAEHHAMSRVYTPQLVGATLVIVTLTARGNFTSGTPCKSCLNLILKNKIERVIVSAPFNS